MRYCTQVMSSYPLPFSPLSLYSPILPSFPLPPSLSPSFPLSLSLPLSLLFSLSLSLPPSLTSPSLCLPTPPSPLPTPQAYTHNPETQTPRTQPRVPHTRGGVDRRPCPLGVCCCWTAWVAWRMAREMFGGRVEGVERRGRGCRGRAGGICRRFAFIKGQ